MKTEENLLQRLIDLDNSNRKYEQGLEYNLGDLIRELKEYPSKTKVLINNSEYSPCYFNSWRGSYCQLGLTYSTDVITVKEFLKMAKKADGSTYIGWKGGEFTMDRGTPIHIADTGRSSGFDGKNMKVVGTKLVDNYVIVMTKDDDEDW